MLLPSTTAPLIKPVGAVRNIRACGPCPTAMLGIRSKSTENLGILLKSRFYADRELYRSQAKVDFDLYQRNFENQRVDCR